MWDFWWMKWYLDRFLEIFQFPLPIYFYQCSMLYILPMLYNLRGSQYHAVTYLMMKRTLQVAGTQKFMVSDNE
jgi:hypothetical protein